MSSLLTCAVRKLLSGFLPAIIISVLTGCTSLPPLDKQLKQAGSANAGTLWHPPTVNDLILKMQCEIKDYSDAKSDSGSLVEQAYVVTANLSADVKVEGQVTPSLNFINPLSTPNTNFTNAIGGQWDGIRHKNFTEQISLDLSTEMKGSLVDCKKENGLGGSFGLKEILDAGLTYWPGKNYLVYDLPPTVCAKDSKVRPVFGATIDFTISLAANGGPTWTVTHFKGPSGSSSWINYSRKEMNTLIVSFAPAELGDMQQCQQAQQKQLQSLDSKVQSSEQGRDRFMAELMDVNGRLSKYHSAESGRQALISRGDNAMSQMLSAAESAQKAHASKDALSNELSRSRAIQKQDAASAAQENNSQMILQNLLLNTH